MNYALIGLVTTGIFMGLSLAFYAKYYFSYMVGGSRKSLKYFLIFLMFGVVLLAIIGSSYLLRIDFFSQYDTKAGRTLFSLLWIVPFCITIFIQFMRYRKLGVARLDLQNGTDRKIDETIGVPKTIRQVAVEIGTPALLVLLALSLVMASASLYLGIFQETKLVVYLGIAVFGVSTLISGFLLVISIKRRSS